MSERTARQTRELIFDLAARAEGSDSIPVVVSSDSVVNVDDGPEILVHTREAVDLRRAPLPIIASHKRGQVNVGIIDGITVEGGKMRGLARFGERDEALGFKKDVLSGVIRAVSVGYQRIHGKVRNDGVLVTDRWMPSHAAMVAEPADISAGFYRSRDESDEAFVVETEQPEQLPAAEVAVETAVRDATTPAGQPAEPQGVVMPEVAAAPAGAPAEREQPNVTALEAEKERREAIVNLCKTAKISDVRVRQNWIENGTPIGQCIAEAFDVMEERGKVDPATASALGLSKKETNRYSIVKAIRALHYGGRDQQFIRDAAFEIECSQTVAKQLGRAHTTSILIPGEVLKRQVNQEAARTMATTPGASGGYLVNVENMGFIDILRNRSVSMRMGARVLSGLQGNVLFSRQTGKPSVTWQAGEGVSITPADQTLGQLSMTPKTCIVRTDVSEQLLRQATPSAEAFIMADLANDVAIDGVDAAVINGTGGAQPIGIKNTSGITSGQDASSATYAKVLAFVSTAGASNAIRGNPGFVTNTAGAAALMKVQRFTSTDTPVWTGNMFDGNLVGFNAMSSEQLSSGNLIFGSWDEVVIGEWGVLELATDSGGTRFDAGLVGIRAMWMVDVLLRYPQAFVVSTNLS